MCKILCKGSRSCCSQACPKRQFLDLFHTEYTEVVDDEGEKITMPVTSAKHLPTLISLVCEKKGLSEDNIKFCLGLDGGQSKLIATLAIIPQNEKDKKGRMAEDLVKNRSKLNLT